MPFNFLSGDGEYQYKDRPLQVGDVFSYLGTPKTKKYLVLTAPVVVIMEFMTVISGSDNKTVKRTRHDNMFSVLNVFDQTKSDLTVDDYMCYFLHAEL